MMLLWKLALGTLALCLLITCLMALVCLTCVFLRFVGVTNLKFVNHIMSEIDRKYEECENEPDNGKNV